MRTIFLLFLLISNFIFASDNGRLLSIEQRKDAWHIFLTNNLEFLWSPSEDENRMLNHWKPGDEISVSPNYFSKGLMLFNDDSPVIYFPQVSLAPECTKNLPTIARLKFDSYRDYIFLTLSNGSLWCGENRDDSIEYWEKGDPILVSGKSLINYRLVASDDENDFNGSCIQFEEIEMD